MEMKKKRNEKQGNKEKRNQNVLIKSETESKGRPKRKNIRASWTRWTTKEK